MKIIAEICLFIVAAGVVLGWFLFGGITGSLTGLILSGCLAVPLYCLASVFKHNAAVVGQNPSSDNPDPTQLPKSAYNRLSR